MELMRRFISPRPESLLQRGAATGRGDGLTMAQAAGAQLRERAEIGEQGHASMVPRDWTVLR